MMASVVVDDDDRGAGGGGGLPPCDRPSFRLRGVPLPGHALDDSGQLAESDHAAVRQVAHDRRPRPAAIGRPEEVIAIVVAPVIVRGHVDDVDPPFFLFFLKIIKQKR